MFLLVISFAALMGSAFAVDITACGTLSAPGTYTLTKDIKVAGSTNCLTVTAADVTIDCNGHKVTGINKPYFSGIYSTKDRTEVKNCVIGNFVYGIRYQGVKNGSVQNTQINVTYSSSSATGAGNTGGNYAAMKNCTITSKGAATGTIGFSIDDSTISSQSGVACSSPTRLVNSKASGGSIGVRLGAMTGPYIANSSITGGSWGVYMHSTAGALLENNSITTAYAIAGSNMAAVKIFLGKPGIVLKGNKLVSSSGKADLVNIQTSQPRPFTGTISPIPRACTSARSPHPSCPALHTSICPQAGRMRAIYTIM